jgi:His/Glu/Gln/Arg/opine family amino acid ABC transporter permease subunit
MFIEVYIRHGLEWAPEILTALWTTLSLSLMAFSLSLAIGIVVAAGRLGRSSVFRVVCRGYVEMLRGIPTLVILFLLYFALPQFGLVMDAFWAGVIGVAIGTGGYAAEVVRAGLVSIHFGQREAALAAGLTPLQALRYVLLPQALRIVLPPLCNLLVIVVKETSLCALISVPELTLAGKDIASATFLPMQIYLLVGLAYLSITVPLDVVARSLESAFGRRR